MTPIDTTLVDYWPLIGVALVVIGFALRLNPALVVVGSGIATGLIAGKTPLQVLELLGEAFTKQRYLALFLLTLPVIGLLERHGLQEHAKAWIAKLRGATAGRALAAYLAGRQLLSALGLVDLGGHAQTVRPLMAPMAVGAAENLHGPLPAPLRDRIKAMTAASDNVGRFFGEDVFVAFGAVLLMQAFFAEQGIALEPLQIALWGIPTALCAFAIHATRLLRMDARLARAVAALQACATQPVHDDDTDSGALPRAGTSWHAAAGSVTQTGPGPDRVGTSVAAQHDSGRRTPPADPEPPR